MISVRGRFSRIRVRETSSYRNYAASFVNTRNGTLTIAKIFNYTIRASYLPHRLGTLSTADGTIQKRRGATGYILERKPRVITSRLAGGASRSCTWPRASATGEVHAFTDATYPTRSANVEFGRHSERLATMRGKPRKTDVARKTAGRFVAWGSRDTFKMLPPVIT